jgi:PBSX family phage portal protein
MTETYKKVKTKGGATRYVPAQDNSNARIRLKNAVRKLNGEAPLSGLGTRQPNQEELVFQKGEMEKHNLIKPPYDPTKMCNIAESGGKLSTCIEVYVSSIEGYGYEFRYTGTKGEEETTAVINEKKALEGFFSRVNESQSTTELRKELRRDYETTGNAYIEVLRYTDKDLAALYRADPKYVRLQAKQKEPIEIKVKLFRNGRMRETTIYKRFRRFAMLIGGVQTRLRYFKEFGDPREMCAITGKYENELENGEKIQEKATEIIHIKQGNDIYGIPRWAGLASVILGINKADFVNYNLFDNNAIPALAVLVSGGRLTSDSVEDIINILDSRNKEDYMNVAILEAVSADSDGNVDDKSSTARVDFKELSKPDDSLFQNYVEKCEKRIMSAFRLPPLLFGEIGDYSRATSSSAKLIVEDAVFSVERRSFDEVFNFTLMAELGAQYFTYFTMGPRLLEGSDLIDAIGKLARAGALSVNQAVRLSNRILDLDTSLYDSPWANIPVALLLELMKKSQVTEIEGVGNMDPEEVQEAANTVKEIAGKSEMDSIAEDVSELKDQLEEMYAMMVSAQP